ncbi:hypothetical protein G6O69_28965 [Pseudenhygromyxa sp. WMMC2535]|uniref:glutaredoxin domain-containing protein n=1 Tax=Pseudenhygromyxa sp. WMMC2535 TaxID=2712867 RepID=UPI0015573A5E|nr:glutaredoxin domain-containing protein [Pseudenhygromyxa sp. WMMC2535]NVB41897.1 hypothetical protein [Pseudenhygromyxa sp. WMMC2535]
MRLPRALATVSGESRGQRSQAVVLAASALSLALFTGCGEEKPPRPDTRSGPAQAAEVAGDAEAGQGRASFSPSEDQFVLTYAGDRGVFADCQSIDDVPEAARGLVGVNLFGRRPPPGEVWVCNLDKPGADGRYALQTVPRADFEEIVLGQGRSSSVALPPGLELPDVQPAAKDGPIIVYKTAWCGVCKQLENYLKRKGVEYVTKDIEADREAAAELAAKAKQAGVPMGSVPMIDVGGELLRGFDRARLEQLLDA